MRNPFWPLLKDLHFQGIGWHNGKPLQKLWLTIPFPNRTSKTFFCRKNCSCGLSGPVQGRWAEQKIFTPIQCLITWVWSTASSAWPFISTICFHQGKGDDRAEVNHHFSVLVWKILLHDLVIEAWHSDYTTIYFKIMIADLHITH